MDRRLEKKLANGKYKWDQDAVEVKFGQKAGHPGQWYFSVNESIPRAEEVTRMRGPQKELIRDKEHVSRDTPSLLHWPPRLCPKASIRGKGGVLEINISCFGFVVR